MYQYICLKCQNTFSRSISLNQSKQPKFCSRHCFNTGRDTRKEKNGNWKGGQVMRKNYRAVSTPDHPRASKAGNYVKEHILIMEAHIGRHLNYYGEGNPNNEVVHHINHNPSDNRIENLQLMSAIAHSRLHLAEAQAIRAKKVRRLDTGEIFNSARSASLAIGMNKGAVNEAIEHNRKCKNTFWEYVTG